MRKYKSLSLDKKVSTSNSSNSRSAKSLQSLDSYIMSMKKKKEYLYHFFDKKDLKIEKSKKYNLDIFVLPVDYYLWKGIDKGLKYDASKNTNGFFANKETAARYGTKKMIYKKGAHVIEPGTDLQFKIIKEIKLLDIGNLDNMLILWEVISSIDEEKLNDASNKFYKFLKKNTDIDVTDPKFLQKTMEIYKEYLVNTCVNYESTGKPDYIIKTPTRCVRKSDEFSDSFLIEFFNAIDDNIDGWIHFNTDDFHDEILIFNVKKHLKYIKPSLV